MDSTKQRVSGRLGLALDGRFGPFFSAQFFGAFNDNFYKNALVLLVTYKFTLPEGVSSQELVSLAGAVFMLPFFLFSASAGFLADRVDKAKVAQCVKVMEMGIAVFAGFAVFRSGPVGLYSLFALLFLLGVHSTFFGPVKYGILPSLVGPDRLLDANALVSGSTFVAIVLGTIAGGATASSQHGEYFLGAGTFLIALIGFLFARRIPPVPGTSTTKVSWDPISSTWKLLRTTLRDKRLRRVILTISWFWLFGSALLSMFPPLCKVRFGPNPDIATAFLVAFAVGIALGSMLAKPMVDRFGVEKTVRTAAFGLSLTSVALGLAVWKKIAAPMPIVIALCFVCAAVAGVFAVPLSTRLQQWTDETRRAQTIAASNVVNAFYMVIGGVTMGLAFRHGVDFSGVFAVLAVGTLIAGLRYREAV